MNNPNSLSNAMRSILLFALLVMTTMAGAQERMPVEVILIDHDVADHDVIEASITAESAVVRVISDDMSLSDVIDDLRDLSTDGPIAGVSIFSHGAPGSFELGGETIDANSTALNHFYTIGALMGIDADLRIYSCEAGRGTQGSSLFDRLAGLTQARVSMSDDVTGVSGDWDLEMTEGDPRSILNEAQLSAAYEHRLQTATQPGFAVSTLASVVTGSGVAGLCADDASGHIFAAAPFSSGSDPIYRIPVSSGVPTNLGVFTASSFFPYIATDMDILNGSIYYASNNTELSVSDVSGATTVNSVVPITAPGAGVNNEAGLAVTPSGTILFGEGNSGTDLFEYDPVGGTFSLLTTTAPAANYQSLEVAELTGQIFYSDASALYEFSAGSFNLIGTFSGQVYNFAVDPTGSFAYYFVQGSSSIRQMDLLTGTAIDFVISEPGSLTYGDITFGPSSAGTGRSLFYGASDDVREISGSFPLLPSCSSIDTFNLNTSGSTCFANTGLDATYGCANVGGPALDLGSFTDASSPGAQLASMELVVYGACSGNVEFFLNGTSIATGTATGLSCSCQSIASDPNIPQFYTVAVTPAISSAYVFGGVNTLSVEATLASQCFYGADVIVTTSCGSVWAGTNGTDWNDAGNWSTGSVPAAADEIIIPTTPSGGNFPSVDFDLTVEDLTVEAGATMDIEPGHVLAIGASGTIDAQGTITLQSDATGTAILDDFSNTGATYTGNLTVETFVAGGLSGENQHFISSPVDAPNVSEIGDDLVGPFGAGLPGTDGVAVTPLPTCDPNELDISSNYGNLFELQESNITTCYQERWVVRSAGNLSNGEGYSAYLPAGSTADWTGTPNTGLIFGSTMTATGTSTVYPEHRRWNLIGNPYPSPISTNAFLSFNAGTFNSPLQYEPSGPFSGTYQAYAPGSNMAVGQGFMALIDPAIPAPIFVPVLFDNSMRTTGPATWKNEAGDYFEHKLEIEVHGNGFADRTEVFFNGEATTDFDVLYDRTKVKSNQGQPTISTGDMLAMNGLHLQDMQGRIPVTIQPGAAGSFELRFSGIETFDASTAIYLEDAWTGERVNLRTADSYMVELGEGSTNERFHLVFEKSSTGVEDLAAYGIDVYSHRDVVTIDLTTAEAERSDVVITDMTGRVVASANDLGQERTKLTVRTASGIYTVVVTNNAGRFTKQVRIAR